MPISRTVTLRRAPARIHRSLHSSVTFALRLTHDEPRLVFLALVYHLARPGSELDPDTLEATPRGLRDVKVRLGSHVLDDSVVIELDETQYRKLLSAIYGSVNELRVLHMRGDSGGVPRFRATALDLFPSLSQDADAPLELAEAMMMLHRRLERAVSRATGDSITARAEGPARLPKRAIRWPFRRSPK